MSTDTGIHAVAEFTVGADNLEQVTEIRDDLTADADLVAGDDVSAAFGDHGKRLTLTITVSSEDTLEALLVRIGPHLAKLDGPATLESLRFAGDVPPALKDAMAFLHPSYAPAGTDLTGPESTS